MFRRTFYRFNQNYSFDQKWSYFFSRYEYLSLTKFEAEFFVWIYGQRGKKEKARFRILEYRPRKWAWWDIYYISGFKGEDHNSNRLLISGSQSDNHPVYLIVNSDSGRLVVTMTNFPHWGNFSSIEWARQRAFIEYIQSIHRKIKEISPRFQIDHKGRGKDVYHL